MRVLKNLVLLSLPALLLCVAAGELFFRFAIPASMQPWGYYDPVDKIKKLELSQGIGLYTIGKFAQQRGRWRVNNTGWNSDVDYLSSDQRTKPLIAVIGDSYIEAFQVDVNASIVSMLRAKLHGQYDVYGFGVSGAPLSQYLQMSRYVTKRFNPDVLVINVVHNDFEKSLDTLRRIPYFLQIGTIGASIHESTLSSKPITAKRTSKLLFKSAIVRYLWHNLKYGQLWGRRGPRQDEETPRAYKTSPHVKAETYRVVDYIVRKMREETLGKELIFMIDAPREDLYAGALKDSEALWQHELLEELTRRYGCRFVDLTGPFLKKYEKDKVRFNSAYDSHWDREGHRYAAEVLYRNLVKFGIVKDRG